jgi:hypothetical protein
MDFVAFNSPAEAARHFVILTDALDGPVKELPEKEQHHARELLHQGMKEFHEVVHSKEESERVHLLGQVRNRLTELERLLAGQRIMFASNLQERVAKRYISALHEAVTQIFKELFSICDAIENLIEADILRQLGIKPVPSVPGKPRVKAPKTYKQAQDEILDALGKAGWRVVGQLKVPHATSPDGGFRFWFKAQAIYFSMTDRNYPSWKLGDARSMWAKDYRFEDPLKFAKGLEAYTEREQRRRH